MVKSLKYLNLLFFHVLITFKILHVFFFFLQFFDVAYLITPAYQYVTIFI